MSDLTPSFKTKDSAASLIYDVDWGMFWLAPAVTITTSTWTITGPDAVLTKDQESLTGGNRTARVRLSAGTTGARYTITNRIVTNESPSQTDERSFELLVQDR